MIEITAVVRGSGFIGTYRAYARAYVRCVCRVHSQTNYFRINPDPLTRPMKTIGYEVATLTQP